MKKSNILLMTATITPPEGVPFLARTDPKARLKDYEEALRFYSSLVNKSIDAIVFAENSNSDVSTLKAIVSQAGIEDQVEFLVFYGLDYSPTYGRAYGEFKLIDYVMEHSQIVRSQGAEVVFWKVTGRYLVKNLAQIVARQPNNFDIYCNFRKIPTPWADMFLMGWTQAGYQNGLHNIYAQLKTSYETSNLHPEEMFIDLLEKIDKNIKIAKRINPAPLIGGVRGSDNADYLEGKNLIKSQLRKIGRVLFPWLWI
jgi:hypothetical protein